MAIRNVSAATLPDLSTAKPGVAPVAINHGTLRTSAHVAALLNGDSAETTVEVARIPSHARIHKQSKLHTVGVAGATDVDLGVAEDPDCLVDGVSLAGAGEKDGASAIAIADQGKALWQLAGLAKDPKAEMSIILTLNTALTGAGEVLVDLVYVCE